MNICPSRAIEKAARETGNFFRLYRWMDEKSIFPVDGGMLEQSAYFVNCCEFVERYINAVRLKKRDAEDKMMAIKSRSRKR